MGIIYNRLNNFQKGVKLYPFNLINKHSSIQENKKAYNLVINTLKNENYLPFTQSIDTFQLDDFDNDDYQKNKKKKENSVNKLKYNKIFEIIKPPRKAILKTNNNNKTNKNFESPIQSQNDNSTSNFTDLNNTPGLFNIKKQNYS
jgi:hypothetical protein